MTAEFQLKKVEVLSGHRVGTPNIPMWYVNHHYTDGSQCIVHDTATHAEALASAVEDASEDGVFVPIEDNSAVR